MTGKFHGVLIFVIFVVDLPVKKISTHENECLQYIRGAWPKHRVNTANFFSALVSNNRYCHPADGIFITNIILSHAVCQSFFEEVA
jgi:hypothetical protein